MTAHRGLVKRRLFDNTVDQLYAAITDESHWLGALKSSASLVGGSGGQFLIWNHHSNQGLFNQVTESIGDKAVNAYFSYYGAIDPRRQLSAELANQVFVCHDYFDEKYARGSEFYQDFLIPSGVRYASVVTTEQVAERAAIFAVFRAPGQPEFDGEARRWLSRLRPHLVRACSLHLRTFALRLSSAVAAGALDALDYPIIVVDEHRMVVTANRAAETLFATGTGLCVRHGRLVALLPNDDSAWSTAIRTAASPERGTPSAAVLTLEIAGKQRYRASVLPISPETALAAPSCRPLALIILGDPLSAPALELNDIRALFGLSPAEARIVLGLARGQMLDDIAAQARVTMNTARSQIKSALRKAGVSRQTDLVRMVSSLPRLRR